MRLTIRFDEEKATALAVLMRDEADRALHLQPAMEAIIAEYLGDQRELFDSAGSSASRPWPELTAGSTLVKEKYGFQGLEVKSGRLRGSLTQPKGAAQGAETYATDSLAVMGTSYYLAQWQSFGTEERFTKKGASRGVLPEREMAVVTEALKLRMFEILSAYVATGSVATGLGVSD